MNALTRIFVPLIYLLAAASPAFADTGVTTEQRVPFAGVLTNDCTGEVFNATGYFHIKTHQSVSLTGRLNTSAEFNFEGLKGVAVATGATYVVAAQTSTSWQRDFDLVPQTMNEERDIVMNRLREDNTFVLGDDLYQKYLMHYTVNANGAVTVDRLDIEFQCR